MYKLNENIEGKSFLKLHQRYFIQRWGELLESTPLHYRKIVKPSLRAILKEALNVNDHYQNQILYENNVFEILCEVILGLKDNFILQELFEEDFKLVKEKIGGFSKNRSSFEELDSELKKKQQLDLPMTILRVLYNKLEKEDMLCLYAKYLVSKLGEEKVSFKVIDDALNLLIGELIYEGHHKQYLYNWGMGVFVRDPETDFRKKIERIRELGKKNRRCFICIIKLKLPDGYESIFDDVKGNIYFSNNPNRLRINLLKKYNLKNLNCEKSKNYFDTEKHIAGVKMEATDKILVVNSARQELRATTKLFSLESKHRQYEPGNLSEVIVLDPNGT